jgi:hypothetical protein
VENAKRSAKAYEEARQATGQGGYKIKGTQAMDQTTALGVANAKKKAQDNKERDVGAKNAKFTSVADSKNIVHALKAAKITENAHSTLGQKGQSYTTVADDLNINHGIKAHAIAKTGKDVGAARM